MSTAQEVYQEKLDQGETTADIDKWFNENEWDIPDKFKGFDWDAASQFALNEGLLWGFGDELKGIWESGAASGPEYRQARDEIRADMQRWKNKNPGYALASEIVGGLPTGGVFAGLGKLAAKKMFKTALPMVYSALGLGALESAAIGAGQSNKDTALGIAGDAALSGAIGGAASGGLSWGGQAVSNKLKPKRGASNVVADALHKSGAGDVDTALQKIEQAGEGAVIADIPGMGSTFRGAATQYGPGRNVAEAAMTERLGQMPGRISRVGEEVIGDTMTVAQHKQYLKYLRKAADEMNYPVVNSFKMKPNEAVLSILNTKDGRKAYRQAFDDYNSWHPDDPMEYVPTSDADTVHSLEIWNNVRKRLGDIAESSKRSGKNARAATVNRSRQEIKTFYNDATDGDYAKALDSHASLMRREEAIEYGQNIIKKRGLKAPDVARHIQKMSPDERKEVLRGVVDEVDTIAQESVEGSNAARKVLRKTATVRNIMAAFPGDELAGSQFIDHLQQLSHQASLATDLLSGSRTAIVQNEQKAVNGLMGGAGAAMASVEPMAAAAGAGAAMSRNFLRNRGQQQTGHIVDLLLSNNGETLADIFKKQSLPPVAVPVIAGTAAERYVTQPTRSSSNVGMSTSGH